MFPGSSPEDLFLTPIDSFYKNYHSEEENDILLSSDEDKLNDLFRDYYINDEDELSYNKKFSLKVLSDSTIDTKHDKVSEKSSGSYSFDSAELIKEDEKVKLSKLLKSDWRSRIHTIKSNLLGALQYTINIFNYKNNNSNTSNNSSIILYSNGFFNQKINDNYDNLINSKNSPAKMKNCYKNKKYPQVITKHLFNSQNSYNSFNY